MSRLVICFLFLLLCFGASAQDMDSVFAVRKGKDLAVEYISKPGESINMIAERFYTPVEKIERMSMIDGRKKLLTGSSVFIPVTTENFSGVKIAAGLDYKTQLYYKVKEQDNIALISMYAGIKKDELILWNSLKGNTLREGQPLFIGWIKIVPRDSINLENGIAYPSRRYNRIAAPDTAKHAFGELDSVYNVQTTNGTNTITEKGTAVFFDKTGKNDVCYAFHNTTQRGTIIKIMNPGTGKIVYAKVLGPIPETKLYANSIIGISSIAKDALGITDNKAWCELYYSPN